MAYSSGATPNDRDGDGCPDSINGESASFGRGFPESRPGARSMGSLPMKTKRLSTVC